MASVRKKLPALILLLVFVAGGGSVVGVGNQHEMCTSEQNDCEMTAGVLQCRCEGRENSPSEAAVTIGRLRLDVAWSPFPFGATSCLAAPRSGPAVREQTSPPCVSPPDFLTLFGALLI